MRYLILVAVLTSACSGGSNAPTTPTPPPAPPVVVTPPVVTPPVTQVTNYAGLWSGDYIIERCSGQGSLEDLFCSARSGGRPGGLYPVGTRLPIDIELSQSGSNVTGLISFGQIRTPVTGVVRSSGLLTLQGSGGGGPYTMSLTYWDAGLQSGEMVGYFSFTTRYQGLNGFAAVDTRLSGVRR